MYAHEMPTPQHSHHSMISGMMSVCMCIYKELHYKGLKTKQKMLHPYRFIGALDPLNKIVGYPNLSHYISPHPPQDPCHVLMTMNFHSGNEYHLKLFI